MARDATAPTQAPQMFVVPAGTASSECRGCKATVYWVVTEHDRRMPVNCDVEGGLRPSRFRGGSMNATASGDGRGISHFVDCPAAGQFRKGKR